MSFLFTGFIEFLGSDMPRRHGMYVPMIGFAVIVVIIGVLWGFYTP